MWPRDWSSDVCSSDLAARWDAARPSTWDSRGRKSDTPFRVNTLLTTHECQEYVDSMLAERRSRSSEEPELACEREGKRMTQDDRKLDEALSTAIAQAGQNLTDEEDLDPGAHLELVARAYRAHGRLGEMVREAAGSARAAGPSWGAGGRRRGRARQAAQQRGAAAAREARERGAGGA